MNLMWLQTFNVVVEEKSLTKAARALHLTQPAVSKQLRSLERYYGVSLLHRTTREVRLTEAGRVVYQYGQKTLEIIKKSRDDVQVLVNVIQGELLLGASTIPGEYILPRFLGLFQQLYPEVKVKMEISDSKEVARKVLEGEIKLGIIGAFIQNQSLQQELFCKDELVVVVPREHKFARRKTITLEEFLSEPLVARERGSGTRMVMENKFVAHGISLTALKIKLELGSTEAVLNAVAAGLGISLVSRLAVQSHTQAGKVAYLRIAGFPLERGLYFIIKKNREPSALLKTFLSFLKNNIPTEEKNFFGVSRNS